MGPVIARSEASFRVDIEAAGHKLIADEPATAGGTDQGPTPYDLLSAALGACTAMTMHFLAKRDNIPLEGVEISITNDRAYAKDCADCTSQSGYIHRFDVQIRLRGNLTPEQRKKLLDAANRCPVRKTLTNEIRIDDKLL
ncbi:MAG TPA: OsmC family protein [Thermoanaerobaculia bacterium]|jgi:putative redox protein